MGRRLRTHVHVRGEVYGPGSDVPAEVAALITNPDVWDDAAPEDPAPAGETGDDSGPDGEATEDSAPEAPKKPARRRHPRSLAPPKE